MSEMSAGIGRAKIDRRRDEILSLLHAEGKVYISDLCTRFGTSPVTIRNDLDVLAEEGKLIRMTGGAVPLRGETVEPTPSVERYEQKKELAVRAAERVRDGDTLFINSGSTTELFASELRTKKNLKVVTNSLSIATELGAIPSFHVILLGGMINSHSRFTYGENAQEQIVRFGADFAVLSVDGISDDGEITTCHAEEAIIDRLMIQRSSHVLIVADESKIGRTGFSLVSRCDGKNDKIEILTNKK